jgi:hypothetical protein
MNINVLKDEMSPAAKSDVVRLSVLAAHGGVWADATMLCMAPLDSWIYPAMQPAGMWMYHGGDDGCKSVASWFIIATKQSMIMLKWKAACDEYWKERNTMDNYFWLDALFNRLLDTDDLFAKEWDSVPSICCNDQGQSHMLAGKVMNPIDNEIEQILRHNPPYTIKLSHHGFDETVESNGRLAIKLSSSSTSAPHKMSNNLMQYPFAPNDFVVVTADCGDVDDVHMIVEKCTRFNVKLLMYDKCNFCHHAPVGVYCRPLKNEGRDPNTYLVFVMRYYENLPANIIFIPGNNKHSRMNRLEKMLIGKVPDSNCETNIDAWNNQADFTLNDYDGKVLIPSYTKPFKAWYERFIGLWNSNQPGVCWNCVMHTTRERIQRHPKSFYASLLEELSGGEALETVHFFERSMRSIF